MKAVQYTPSVDFHFEDDFFEHFHSKGLIQSQVKLELSCTNQKKGRGFADSSVSPQKDINKSLQFSCESAKVYDKDRNLIDQFDSHFVITFDNTDTSLGNSNSKKRIKILDDQFYQKNSINQGCQQNRLSLPEKIGEENLFRIQSNALVLKSDIITHSRNSRGNPKEIQKFKRYKKAELRAKHNNIQENPKQLDKQIIKQIKFPRLVYPQTCRNTNSQQCHTSKAIPKDPQNVKILNQQFWKRKPLKEQTNLMLKKGKSSVFDNRFGIKGYKEQISAFSLDKNLLQKSNIIIKLPSIR